MLDEAGYPDCNITASNSLDEYIINDMILQGAKVDCFIVGERLINSASAPLFSGVYKLSAVEKDGEIIPKINLSENVSKITTRRSSGQRGRGHPLRPPKSCSHRCCEGTI